MLYSILKILNQELMILNYIIKHIIAINLVFSYLIDYYVINDRGIILRYYTL